MLTHFTNFCLRFLFGPFRVHLLVCDLCSRLQQGHCNKRCIGCLRYCPQKACYFCKEKIYSIQIFFVKSQHSVLKFCHLTFFFLTKKLKKILKKKIVKSQHSLQQAMHRLSPILPTKSLLFLQGENI